MLRSIQDFKDRWQEESSNTLRLFGNLTDESLQQAIPGGRTLGRLANHIIETLTELPHKLGLPIEEEFISYPTVAELITAYQEKSAQLVNAVTSQWNNDSLELENNLYGDSWKNGFSLWVIIVHQAHHRAQMTVLMRTAGLIVPGLYGPAKEEWIAWGETPQE